MMKTKGILVWALFLSIMTNAQLPAPVPSCSDTVFSGKLRVTISCSPGAMVYYTTDRTIPTVYSTFAPEGWTFVFDSTVTLTARALKKKTADASDMTFDSSAVVIRTYTKRLSPPVFHPYESSFSDSCVIAIWPPEKGATVHYTLDGSEPTTASARFEDAIVIRQTTTIRCIAVKQNRLQSGIYTRQFMKLH